MTVVLLLFIFKRGMVELLSRNKKKNGAPFYAFVIRTKSKTRINLRNKIFVLFVLKKKKRRYRSIGVISVRKGFPFLLNRAINRVRYERLLT